MLNHSNGFITQSNISQETKLTKSDWWLQAGFNFCEFLQLKLSINFRLEYIFESFVAVDFDSTVPTYE
jgi:hypothetical protein